MPSIPFTGSPPAGPLSAGDYVILTGPVVPLRTKPVASFASKPEYGVVGSVVRLDGRASKDADGSPLTYKWEFVSVPIGSRVRSESFRILIDDAVPPETTERASVVSFSPDLVGEYVIRLTVSNGTLTSEEVQKSVSIRSILVPHARGIVPDGKFIWSYLRDVWTQVEGREWFETLWSALIQISGTELLKLYQVDFNKSIRDIQDNFQRRWLSYEPKLSVVEEDSSFFLGNHLTGTDASTVATGLSGKAIILSSDEVVVVSGGLIQNARGDGFEVLYSQSGNTGLYKITNLNSKKTGYKLSKEDAPAAMNPALDRMAADVEFDFTFESKTWSFSGSLSTVNVGDVIHYKSGTNVGFYQILEKSGSTVTVDKAPSSFSDAVTSVDHKADIYRPVGFKLSHPEEATTDTFVIPLSSAAGLEKLEKGRIIILGGRAYTLSRVAVDAGQEVPLVVVTVEKAEVPTGLRSLNWRVPHTLVSSSQNFESLGVSSGDLLLWDVIMDGKTTTAEVATQVVGASEDRLGFVLTDQAFSAGTTPPIPAKTFTELSSKLGINSVREVDGELVLFDEAASLNTYLSSAVFSRLFWNRELTPDSEINAGGHVFSLKPKTIYRNKMIPVHQDLVSVPALQEFIAQPQIVERDGKFYQVKGASEFLLKNKPVNLTENNEFVIDEKFAFEGELTFIPGTTNVNADDGDFLDRGITPGDTFEIISPVTLAGRYTIRGAPDNNRLSLVRPVPEYILPGPVTVVARIERRNAGRYMRFSPGVFTAAAPVPARLWAEVSFFDNGEAIENNFGILVGLTREDLEEVSTNINYRQAIAGLMFAYTRGSAIDRVRLGAQILLGLPFAEHRGIIRSIEEDYRLDIRGNPTLGRLLIEDIDQNDQPMGTLRVYTFPVDDGSELAGIETNPDTGQKYRIGEIVDLFAALSKGVEITDYLTDDVDASFSDIRQLQKFHSIRLKANDSIFSLQELSLVSEFLKKITPSYVAFTIASATEIFDEVDIEDGTVSTLRGGDFVFVDNASLNVPPAVKFDMRRDGIHANKYDSGLHWIRRTGWDLATVNGSSMGTSSAGQLVNPASGEGPVTKIGDKLAIYGGVNAGLYNISAVADGSVTVDNAPALGFQTATGQRFAILRPVSGEIRRGTATVTNGDPVIVVEAGLRADGVAPEDFVTLPSTSTPSGVRRHRVIAVEASGSSYNRLRLFPAPDVSGAQPYRVYRPAFIESPYKDLVALVSDGTNVTSFADAHLLSLLDPGDEMKIDDGNEIRLTALDPQNKKFTPVPAAGSYMARICKKGHPKTVVGFDHISKFDRIEQVDVALVRTTSDASISGTGDVTIASITNPATAGLRPGDLFQATSGANSTVDVGYGAGVYPIIRVDTSKVYLGRSMTAETVSWKVIRRR